ncbi:MAG TPA: PEP-utilizing enzyme, partial [Candidatus Limnocylindria bacterium]|nr:PEP-utilizing enzyme [Candidatus Limnocylindria bacterium]
LPLTRTLMLRREASRILAHVQCNDVARGAARILARDRVRRGLLDEPDDVFHLTFDEAMGDGHLDESALAASRRARWIAYQALDLPMRWIGRAQPIVPEAFTDSAAPVTGVGASPGVVEGRACVVLDPAEADDFQPDDVLVCRTTDPGWAALFVVASAVVIDIGGTMSHGAIVARELGIPCVIGTGDGSRRIRSGARLRVDGAAGRVEIVG